MKNNSMLKNFKIHDRFILENILNTMKEGIVMETPVIVYHMVLFSKIDENAQSEKFVPNNGYLHEAGLLAGIKFAKQNLDLNSDLIDFINALQKELQELKIGHFRIEAFDPGYGDIVITIGHEFERSEIPVKNNNLFIYDENFILGILETYTETRYETHDLDSWYTPVKKETYREEKVSA